uniref:Uncharacterized protein n=1 Tax=Coccidioides posadasii RMSCC 3488 TaxID=454284 RepID=A0A0J6FT64_COCPO|nr:hypothetical protein CPAG_08581 [Coccidioides posadasii RMSCC 3488]
MGIKGLKKRHATSVSDLSREDIRVLARLFYFTTQAATPEDAWIFVSAVVASLPRHLRRSKVCDFFCTTLRLLPSEAKSCSLHKRLNSHVISSIFRLVQLEVGPRLDRLAMHRSRLTVKQRIMVDTLREINGMWMTSTRLEKEFSLPSNTKWYFQASGCEGCILSRILQDATAIKNLRTVLLSRTRTRGWAGKPPKLIRWVEESMACHGESRLDIFVRSGEDAAELKEVRKTINKLRRRRYCVATEAAVPEEGVNEEEPGKEAGREESRKEGREEKAEEDLPGLLSPRPSSSIYSGRRALDNDNDPDLDIEIIRLYQRDSRMEILFNETDSPQTQCPPHCNQSEHPGASETIHEAEGKQEVFDNNCLHYGRHIVAGFSNEVARSATPKTSRDWADEYRSILTRDPRVEYSAQSSWGDASVIGDKPESNTTRWSTMVANLQEP